MGGLLFFVYLISLIIFWVPLEDISTNAHIFLFVLVYKNE